MEVKGCNNILKFAVCQSLCFLTIGFELKIWKEEFNEIGGALIFHYQHPENNKSYRMGHYKLPHRIKTISGDIKGYLSNTQYHSAFNTESITGRSSFLGTIAVFINSTFHCPSSLMR